MRGAAIAAANRNAKKRIKSSKDSVDKLNTLAHAHPAVLATNLDVLEEILRHDEGRRVFGVAHAEADVDQNRRFRILTGLIEKVEQKISRSTSYTRLAATFLFFVIALVVVFMQRDVASANSVETSFVNALISRLPVTGSGGYFNSGTGATGVLSSTQELYDWLSDALVSNVFIDPVCGDGRCEAPDEYPGFGRFGCVADCGSFDNVTVLSLELMTFLQSQPNGIDLGTLASLQGQPDPGFSYNIYSETMGDWLWADDMTNLSTAVLVPDGKLSLHLYQGNLVSRDVEPFKIRDALAVVPSTLPYRVAAKSFDYGDARDVLASASVWVRGLAEYCTGPTGLSDSSCAGFSDYDYIFKTLSAYGFSGSIRTTVADAEVKLVNLSFCSVFPNGAAGLGDASNRDAFKAAAAPCSGSTGNQGRRSLRPRVRGPRGGSSEERGWRDRKSVV